jgi:thiol:disulfide interchange protein DsbD
VFSDKPGARFLASIPSADEPKEASPGLLRFLLFAFLGGILLNAMPCVLPVVSLKILSLVSHANEERGKLARLGLSLAAGVMVSFLALAGVVIAMQSAGEHVGWGFQFQSPGFVAGLAVVVFVFSLSLLGVYEIHLPVGGIGGAQRKAHADAFMNGVLTTVLATPCTAPMLGPAVGFAFTQSAGVIVAIFLAVGLGLMLPYLLLTLHPGWLRFVPKPGEWMVTFKQVMGLILLATLLWLVAVFGAQTGVTGVVRLLAFLFAIGVLAWAHGRFVTLSSTRAANATFWTIAAVVVVLCYHRVLREAIAAPPGIGGLDRPPPQLQASDGVTWDPFTRATLDSEVASGNTVFLDFTAEWCWTCKVNERTVLADKEVESLFLEYDVVTLKGDWTRRDPEITALLKEHGRAGVPFYAVYPAGNRDGVIVLPELINKKLVLDSLRKAGPSRAGRA